MFHCKFNMCEHVSETVVQFIQHTKLHSNTPHYHYQCGVPDCTRLYRKAAVLKTHMYRDHRGPGSTLQHCKTFDTPLKCAALTQCFQSMSDILQTEIILHVNRNVNTVRVSTMAEHSLICPLYLVNLNQIKQPNTQLTPFVSMAKSICEPWTCAPFW